MLVRRIARPLLATPFIYGGISTLRKPQDRVPGARPVVEKLTETADKQLPVELPRDVEQYVKVNAGALLALGRLPRLSALALAGSTVPTTLAGHRFWEEQDPKVQFEKIAHFVKNVGMLGGLLLAAVDTEGKPSLGYRARRAAKKAAAATERELDAAQKRAAKAEKQARKRTKK